MISDSGPWFLKHGQLFFRYLKIDYNRMYHLVYSRVYELKPGFDPCFFLFLCPNLPNEIERKCTDLPNNAGRTDVCTHD